MTIAHVRSAGRLLLDRSLGLLSWATARAVGHDMTDKIGTSRLLVLAPHPDDETLACGGWVARTLGSGGSAFVVIATDGRFSQDDVAPDDLAATRRIELYRATAALGLAPSHVEWLGYEDASLASHVDELEVQIRDLVRDHQPTIVLSPWAHDTHADHAALGRAARAASVGSQVVLLEYVVWAWIHPSHLLQGRLHKPDRASGTPLRSRAGVRRRRPVVIRTDGYLRTKTDALREHQSQLGPSAGEVRLPPGEGSLDARFIRRFLGPTEMFFPFTSDDLGGGHRVESELP